MSKTQTQRKPIITKHVRENQKPQKSEKQPSWVRGLLACRNVEVQQQHHQQQQQQQQKEAKPQPRPQEAKQLRKKEEQRKVKEERAAPEENSNKKYKKMKCSGSLCNNAGVMAKPVTGTGTATTQDVQKKKNTDGSSRSMKAPLAEINGPVSASSSSLSAASSNSSGGGSFRAIPFRRLSGCYECRMVVDPVLGFTRDPSLRSSICSCPDCGEIMKAESLEHHQAVKHAGTFFPEPKRDTFHISITDNLHVWKSFYNCF